MRPSWDWEHGKRDASSGTPGHTREPEEHSEEPESLDEDESFFQAGDEGRYEGGPALLMTEEPVELDQRPVAVVVRTPEQDARRARLVRIVAMAVGAFAALFAFGVVKQRKADASPERAPVSVAGNVEAPASQRRDVTPQVVEKPAPAPASVAAPEPEPVLEKTVAAEAKPEAPAVEEKLEKPKKTIAKAASFAGASLAEESSAPASKPVVTTSVTAVPQGQASGTGNVGNFASKGPGSDVARPSMPTASFPVQ